MHPADTQRSTGNNWLRSKETQLHWRGEQMYDLQTRSLGWVEWVSWKTRIDEVYTDSSKINERVGVAAVTNRHFQNGETTSHQLSKRLPDNSTISAVDTTAISLALNYYWYMGAVHHHVVVYFDSVSCLQAIEGDKTENPFICHIMDLLCLLNDKGTHACFCWIPSHCGIEGNERVD